VQILFQALTCTFLMSLFVFVFFYLDSMRSTKKTDVTIENYISMREIEFAHSAPHTKKYTERPFNYY